MWDQLTKRLHRNSYQKQYISIKIKLCYDVENIDDLSEYIIAILCFMQIRIIINHIPSVIGILHLYGTDKNIIFQTKRFDPYCHLSRKVKKDMVLGYDSSL